MARPVPPEHMHVSPDDPLAEEHRTVMRWIEEAVALVGEERASAYEPSLLKECPSGRKLLQATADQARRYALAAAIQFQHWLSKVAEFRARVGDENPHHSPGWGAIWCRRRAVEVALRALLRRKLPFDEKDLLVLLGWCKDTSYVDSYFYPVVSLVRTLEQCLSGRPPGDDLRAALRRLATLLRTAAIDRDANRLAARVERLCGYKSDADGETERLATQPPPRPAPAGMTGVLHLLKQRYGMLSAAEIRVAETLEPDQFPLVQDSPLVAQHRLLSKLLGEVAASGLPSYRVPKLEKFPSGRVLLNQEPGSRALAALATAERYVHLQLRAPHGDERMYQARNVVLTLLPLLLKRPMVLPRDGTFDLLLFLAVLSDLWQVEYQDVINESISAVQEHAKDKPLTEGERFVLHLLRTSLIPGPPLGTVSAEVAQLTRLIGDRPMLFLAPGEVWAEAVNEDLAAMDAGERELWGELLAHCLTASSARPSKKWLNTALEHVQAIGPDLVRERLERWFSLVPAGRSFSKLHRDRGEEPGAIGTMNDGNATCLRGLLWLTQTLPRPESLARVISSLAISAYKKVPGVGPRAVKVGNAAIYALSNMRSPEAVGQLAILKTRVKFGTAQKEIAKAFRSVAEALDVPGDEVEELAVPTFGLQEVGRRSENVGGYRAELIVTGSDASLTWFDPKGKALKSTPAKVRKEYKDEVDELKRTLKDIKSSLVAQRDRIESLFLARRSWPFDQWRERYLDHPLVGTIARRLIWCIDGVPVLPADGVPRDIDGNPVRVGENAEVTLWHPIGRTVDEIVAWRDRLEELGITQPFKQAHREIYLLTDAERRTRVYSNRFAAHVVRQHQFSALAAARGWKYTLQLLVDGEFPPATKELPAWGIRAEYWVYGIGENYGQDTNESGVFWLLSTDQVRFYRIQAAQNTVEPGGRYYASAAGGPGPDDVNEPLPLEEIPPLVFSEVMRDVDLFVGVASIGNDPTWQDGGPEARFRDYWHGYAFGELSATAATRKEVLERLVPRLKIADRCSFTDRFLVVRGQKRTYKIHLGSGNILMEPNDQYLCIVPDPRGRLGLSDLFLPFEGDAMLSVIISKALLLAEDSKITDRTILHQIEGK